VGERRPGGEDGGVHPRRSSDRWSFDAHYHRIRDNPDDTVLAVEDDGVLVGMVGSFPSEVGREVTFWIDPG
jgi:hypothetical protein